MYINISSYIEVNVCSLHTVDTQLGALPSCASLLYLATLSPLFRHNLLHAIHIHLEHSLSACARSSRMHVRAYAVWAYGRMGVQIIRRNVIGKWTRATTRCPHLSQSKREIRHDCWLTLFCKFSRQRRTLCIGFHVQVYASVVLMSFVIRFVLYIQWALSRA